MKNEKRNQRILALIFAIILTGLCYAFGQDVQARGFRDESKAKYDSQHYYNLALLTYCDGKLEQNDSIQIFIRERDSTTAVMFTVCEKTDVYLAYNRFYLISIARKGYSAAQLLVNSGVKIKEYGDFIPVYLEKGNSARSIGIVVWDSRINNVHYYPEPCSFE